MANIDKLDYYRELFKQLNELICRKIHQQGTQLRYRFLERFSLNVLCHHQQEGQEQFFWLINDEQLETIMMDQVLQKRIKDSYKGSFSREEIIKALDFKFDKTGFISYFFETGAEIEIFDLRNMVDKVQSSYKSAEGFNIDLFKAIEYAWGWDNFKYVYIRFRTRNPDYRFIGVVPLLDEEFATFFYFFPDLQNAVFGASLMGKVMQDSMNAIRTQQLHTAINAILVDSYAHNISAHSLVALENWFMQRAEKLDYKKKGVSEIRFRKNVVSGNELKRSAELAESFYKALGLGDQTNTREYVSLADLIRFGQKFVYTDNMAEYTVERLLKGEETGPGSTVTNTGDQKGIQDKPQGEFRLPVPVDYAIWPFIRFLKGKAAFWSGVTRNVFFGGEHISLYDLIFRHFVENPLYVGTIAHSEGVTKLNIKIGLTKGFGDMQNAQDPLTFYDFAQIDTSLLGKGISELGTTPSNGFTGFNLHNRVNYTDYGFIRLGNNFDKVRKALTKEIAFLPGGIIGVHAFLTILENTIRNVKHYKSKESEYHDHGLTLLISFEQMDLFNQPVVEKPNRTDKKTHQHRLYRVGVGIGHEIPSGQTPQDDVRQKLFGEILSKDGKANLGGTSQDKICSAFLMCNKFDNVETIRTARDWFYYPWIHAIQLSKKEISQGETFDNKLAEKLRGHIHKNQLSLNKKEKFKIIRQSGNKNSNGAYFIKFFNLWKSEQVITLPSVVDEKEGSLPDTRFENFDRFRIGVVDDEKNRIQYQKQGNIYRLVENPDTAGLAEPKPAYSFEDYYEMWIKKNFNTKKNIAIFGLDGQNNELLYFLYSCNGREAKENYFEARDTRIVLAHRGDFDGSEVLRYRSHGTLQRYFFNFRDIFNIKGIENRGLILDFFETVQTTVKIWDNRISNLFESFIPATHRSKFERSLNLYITNESIGAEQFKVRPLSPNDPPSGENHTIFVIHLSYINSLYAAGHPRRDSGLIDWFISHYLKGIMNYTLCITSGLGNSEWYSQIAKDYPERIIFRPIESFTDYISDALKFGDDFQLKYNICKLIYGS